MEPFNALEVRRRLQSAGVLPTLQRMAVAAVLMQRPVRLGPEQVHERTRELLPTISRATVDRVLRLFARKGLLQAPGAHVTAG